MSRTVVEDNEVGFLWMVIMAIMICMVVITAVFIGLPVYGKAVNFYVNGINDNGTI